MKAYAFALVLIAFTSPSALGAESETGAKELHGLQGTWTVFSSEQDGEKRRDLDEVKKMRLTIKNDKWSLEYHNNVKDKHVATLKLDPTQKPKAVDLKFSEGLLTGETQMAIYELNGDNLKFCLPGESMQRPKNFDSREGIAGHWVLVLEREK